MAELNKEVEKFIWDKVCSVEFTKDEIKEIKDDVKYLTRRNRRVNRRDTRLNIITIYIEDYKLPHLYNECYDIYGCNINEAYRILQECIMCVHYDTFI